MHHKLGAGTGELRPQPLIDFCAFSEKIAILNAIWITFRTFLDPFEKTKLLKLDSHYKQLNCQLIQPPYLLMVKYKTCLNACILGLNFLRDLAKGKLKLP